MATPLSFHQMLAFLQLKTETQKEGYGNVRWIISFIGSHMLKTETQKEGYGNVRWIISFIGSHMLKTEPPIIGYGNLTSSTNILAAGLIENRTPNNRVWQLCFRGITLTNC